MPNNRPLRMPPAQVQAGNMPVLAEEPIQQSFLEALAASDGNLSRAASLIGISRQMVYRHMARENLFREQVGVVQALAIQGRAHELLHGTYDHLASHIEHGWEPVLDDEGNQVFKTDRDGQLILDDDFEPIPELRSLVSIKSLEGLAREMRHASQGEDAKVQINNVNETRFETPLTAPPVASPGFSVLDDDIPDAEIVEIDQGEET